LVLGRLVLWQRFKKALGVIKRGWAREERNLLGLAKNLLLIIGTNLGGNQGKKPIWDLGLG